MESQPKSLDDLTVLGKAYRLVNGAVYEVECIPFQEPLEEDLKQIDENQIFFDRNGPYRCKRDDFFEDSDGTIVYTRHYLETLPVSNGELVYQEI